MANLIDTTYFIEEIEIPNVNQTEIEDDVTGSITQYEREVLISLLGNALYVELRDSAFVDGDASIYDKLVNGDDFSYTLNSQTVELRWDGLRGFEKKSLIAYYVYYMHRRKRASYHAGTGIEVEAASDNAKPAQVYHKMVEVWNEFINMYGDPTDEYGNVQDIPNVLDNYTHHNNLASAYNYLLAKKADFPTWKFNSMGGELNRFGI
jgi:hypothetical protein